MSSTSSQPAAPSARFPGFDGLRTILSLLVVCSHLEEFKTYFPSFPRLGIHSFFGSDAVQCFFVLSGFLITFLLLQEEAKTGQINVRQFYWKRVLRIWPLYFTITALAFFVVPALVNLANFPNAMQSFHQPTWWFYVVILPNLALLNYPLVLGASQLWSIGIEEQFYLVWPWLKRACKSYFPSMLLASIFAKPLLVALAGGVIKMLSRHGYIESQELVAFLLKAQLAFGLFPFECLAWGGLFAYLVHSRNEFWPRLLGHPASQVASWAALAVFLFAPLTQLHSRHIHLPLSGLLYGLAVWNIGANPRTLIGLRARWLNKFGALTYGIYMWHLLVIIAVFSILNAIELPAKVSPWVLQVVLFGGVIGTTVLVAQLSFTWLEMPFLRIKDRWFGQAHANPAKNTLPTLASIVSAPHGKAGGNTADRKRESGTRAA